MERIKNAILELVASLTAQTQSWESERQALENKLTVERQTVSQLRMEIAGLKVKLGEKVLAKVKKEEAPRRQIEIE